MKITRRRVVWGIVVTIFAVVLLFFPLIWTVQLTTGTARLITTSVPIQVFMDGVEIPGSYGFITLRGFNHIKRKHPILIAWIPRSQPSYDSHGRMIMTFVRDEETPWVGTPNSDIPEEQVMLFHRYLLQTEDAGLAIQCGDSLQSFYGDPKLHFENDRIRFSLTPNKEESFAFPSHELEIRVPPEVLAQMAP